MVINESWIFLAVFFAVVIIGILVVYSFGLPSVKKFELLLTYLGAFAALMFTYDIYINIRFNDRVEKNRMAYNTTENIQKNYLLPQKESIDYYPESFFIYASMNPDIDFSDLTPKNFDPAKRKGVEVYLSLRVFQSVEDFLSTASFDITGMYVWLNNYLMWMQSPILQAYWKILAFNYADDTRALMGRIIEKANYLVALRKEKGTLTSQDYNTISKSFHVTAR